MMTKARITFLMMCGLWLLMARSEAQVKVVGPGSTVPGDVLRGEGVYLQGLSWYELNDAKAAAMNAETQIKMEKWNRELQAAYRQQYNALVEQKRYRTAKAFEEAKRKQEERDVLLRTKPTQEDLQKGDALNALLADLSDPSIQDSSWRGAKVALPPGISIKSLAFQFAPKLDAKESAALARGLIALGRLDTSGKWPDSFPLDKLTKEISAYESSYRKIREQSLAGRILLDTVFEMDRALASLEASVGKVVPPERGFKTKATQYVRDLKQATGMFNADTLDFARAMIADTNSHEAHTVGELLAFMRKYRLLFANASASPGGLEMYAQLYRMLREQKDLLGITSGPNGQVIVEKPRGTKLVGVRQGLSIEGDWKTGEAQPDGSVLRYGTKGKFRLSILVVDGESFSGEYTWVDFNGKGDDAVQSFQGNYHPDGSFKIFAGKNLRGGYLLKWDLTGRLEQDGKFQANYTRMTRRGLWTGQALPSQ